MFYINNIVLKNNSLQETKDEIVDIESKQYTDLLRIYEIAMYQVTDGLKIIQDKINQIYGYNMIEKVYSRVKSKKSIINKMKKKNLELTYPAMVENLNDIAGVRIVCPIKEDIVYLKNIIHSLPNLKVLKEKDYVTKPKKSGYSAYHMIVETPVCIKGETIPIKVEIQIRTVAMDFWSEMEHDIRYKTNNKVSIVDSCKLTWYSKVLEKIQRKMIKVYRKNSSNAVYYNN